MLRSARTGVASTSNFLSPSCAKPSSFSIASPFRPSVSISSYSSHSRGHSTTSIIVQKSIGTEQYRCDVTFLHSRPWSSRSRRNKWGPFMRVRFASSSSPPPPSVDYLEDLEGRDRRKSIAIKVLIGLFVLAILVYWFFYKPYAEASAVFQAQLERVADPETLGQKETVAQVLETIFNSTKRSEHWKSVLGKQRNLVPILRPFLTSPKADERKYAALLIGYAAENSAFHRQLILDSGILQEMIKLDEPACRVGTLVVLQALLRDGERTKVLAVPGMTEYLKVASMDHDPLIRTYGIYVQYRAGQVSLGDHPRKLLDQLLKSFDFTRPYDKELMASSMRTLSGAQQKDAYIQFAQGYWFQLFGYAKEAKVAYTRALNVDASCVDALWELGRIYLLEYQADRTLVLWSRLVQERPDFPPLLRWMRETEQQQAAATLAASNPSPSPVSSASNPASSSPSLSTSSPPATEDSTTRPMGPPLIPRALLTLVPAREDTLRILYQLQAMQKGAAIPVPTIASSAAFPSPSSSIATSSGSTTSSAPTLSPVAPSVSSPSAPAQSASGDKKEEEMLETLPAVSYPSRMPGSASFTRR